MKHWTSLKATYFLMSLLLIVAMVHGWWLLVGFVAVMQQVAVWFSKCPSLWFFNSIGLKKTEL